MTIKQDQKAGDNSQQLLIGSIYNIGITEERARKIYSELIPQSIEEYSSQAKDLAQERIAIFEEKLLTKMESIEGAFSIFGDPSFQLLLTNAQKGAASTERKEDYDLLAELLIHRFSKFNDQTTKVGVTEAVKIVDKIPSEALIALTAVHSFSYFKPFSGDIDEGLDNLEKLFSKVLYAGLPLNEDWLDTLDILKAIRIKSDTLKKTSQYYSEILAGYVDVGIRKESESHHEATRLLRVNYLDDTILVEHSLNKEYVRLNIVHVNRIDTLSISEEQKGALRSIYNGYINDDLIKQQNITSFILKLNLRSNLRKFQLWWDSIETGFQITSVGKVLAHANAQRCDPSLPPLN